MVVITHNKADYSRRLDSVLKKIFAFIGLIQLILLCFSSCQKEKVEIAQIIFDKSEIEMYVGESMKIKANVIPMNAEEKILQWTSSHPEIASVNNGLITGITSGKATISAKIGKKIATCLVTIKLKQYTVTFNSNGGSEVLSQTVYEGETLTRPNHPSKPGHYFNGWYFDRSFKEPFSFNYPITESFTLYAKWVPLDYTITFVTNSPTIIEPKKVTYNQYLEKPDEPQKDGFTFIGWYIDEDLTIPFNYQINPIVQNLTVYAKWEVMKYQVRFVTNNGEADVVKYVAWKEIVEEPKDITKEGYKLVGWYRDSQYQNIFNINFVKIDQELTLYAKWEIKKLNVSFITNSDEKIESIKIDWNTLLDLPSNPDKLGHEFRGWYYDEDFTSPFLPQAPITSDLILYAKWEIKSFMVTFETFGGSTIEPLIVEWNSYLDNTIIPVRRGYTFTGWFINNETTLPFTLETPITTDTVLFAKWDEDPLKPLINFDLNDGYWSIDCYSGLINDEAILSFPLGTYNVTFYDKNMYYLSHLMLYSKDCNLELLINIEDTYKVGIEFNQKGYYICEIVEPLGVYDFSKYDYTIVCNDQYLDGLAFIKKLIIGELITITGTNLNASGVINGLIEIYKENTIIYDNGIYDLLTRLPKPIKEDYQFGGWFDVETNEEVEYAKKYMSVYALWIKK